MVLFKENQKQKCAMLFNEYRIPVMEQGKICVWQTDTLQDSIQFWHRILKQIRWTKLLTLPTLRYFLAAQYVQSGPGPAHVLDELHQFSHIFLDRFLQRKPIDSHKTLPMNLLFMCNPGEEDGEEGLKHGGKECTLRSSLVLKGQHLVLSTTN